MAFLTSPSFVSWSLLVAVLAGVMLLWKAARWTARGLTPKDQIEEHRRQWQWFTGLLPKSSTARNIILGAVAILGIVWALSLIHVPSGTVPSLGAPSLTDVWATTTKYWLWILILFVVAFIGLIFVPEKKTTITRRLYEMLWVMLFALFIGFPIILWVQDTASHRGQMVVRPLLQHDVSLPRAWRADGTMMDPLTWAKVEVPPRGNSVPVATVFGTHVVWGGSGFRVHCVYADGHEGIIGDVVRPCHNGDMVKMYARNDGETPVYASYAYARQDEK